MPWPVSLVGCFLSIHQCRVLEILNGRRRHTEWAEVRYKPFFSRTHAYSRGSAKTRVPSVPSATAGWQMVQMVHMFSVKSNIYTRARMEIKPKTIHLTSDTKPTALRAMPPAADSSRHSANSLENSVQKRLPAMLRRLPTILRSLPAILRSLPTILRSLPTILRSLPNGRLVATALFS